MVTGTQAVQKENVRFVGVVRSINRKFAAELLRFLSNRDKFLQLNHEPWDEQLMETLIHLIQNLHTPEGLRQLIQTGGLVGLVGIIFAETGLLIGFFLPGDSLLVTAGIFASSGAVGGEPLFSLPMLLVSLSIAAVVGDQLGYYLGRKTGPHIFKREDSLLFKRHHAERAHEFYLRKGPWAVVLARFIPIFRTFVPFMAGVAQMPYKTFLKFNIFGGIIWIHSMILTGYFLGKSPLADQVHKVILVVVFLSLLPIIIPAVKSLLTKLRTR